MDAAFPTIAGVSLDVRGALARFEIDCSLFSEDVALRAAYWLADRGYVYLSRDDSRLFAEIRCKDGQGGEPLTSLCGEFCNGLVDFSLRARIAAESEDIQSALLQRAFVELIPKPERD